ncbi:nicotinamide N-methyltransferase-like [Lissotriton helveticus]
MAEIDALKELHEQHFDTTLVMDVYTGQESDFIDDTISGMLPLFNKIFTSGGVKGELLINLCLGSYVEWAFPACEYFTEIIVGASTDSSTTEIEKWRKNESVELDWSHVAKALCEIQGKGEKWPEKQNIFKQKIKQVLKCDVRKSNPLSPTVLPQADCLLLTHCLAPHVTNKEEFCCTLKNVSSMLKNGGHLVWICCLMQTFYMIGSFKFPHLSIDESFVRKALSEGGFVILELQVFSRRVNHLYHLADYESFAVVHARKEMPTCTTYES